MGLRDLPNDCVRATARCALLVFVGISTSVCLADPPAGAYGPTADVQNLPLAAPVPARPGTKIGPVAKLGFTETQDPQPIPINLPTALRLANASNPTIALAQARVQEAYAHLREARVMWIPDLSAGPAYLRHDGLLQTSTGNVLNVNKWNLFVGGQAEFAVDTSQAFFAPLIARQLVQAQAAGARATQYQIQLDVANAYLDLLHAYGALAINREILSKTEDMYGRTRTTVGAGVELYTSDLPRAAAALELRRQQRMQAQAQVVVASGRLTRLLFLDPTVDLQPADLAVLPIELVPSDIAIGELVSLGLMNRPELAQSRYLVGAADAQYRQTRLAPLLPHLDVSYSAGEFGGGINDSTISWGGRGDATAQATWQLHNFGLGDLARVRAQRAVANQAMAHVLEIQAQIGEEVSTAAKTVGVIQKELQNDQNGVRQAEEMWTRLEKIDFGATNTRIGHLEVLQPLTAIDQLQLARTAYLDDVIAYDRAQFQLYWAMGQPPICALPKATAVPTQLPVRPTEAEMARPRHIGLSDSLPRPGRCRLELTLLRQGVQLQDRAPIACGHTVAKKAIHRFQQPALENAACTPDIGDPVAQGQGVRSPGLLGQRLQLRTIGGTSQECRQQTGRIVGHFQQRILRNDFDQARGRNHQHPRGHSQPRSDGAFDGLCSSRGISTRRSENDVAAIEQRAHVAVTEFTDENPEVRHGHAFGAADVDATKQRDVGGGHVSAADQLIQQHQDLVENG